MYQCLASDFDSKVEKRIQSIIRQMDKYGYSADYKVISREIKEIPYYAIVGDYDKRRKFIRTIPCEVVNYEFNMPDFKVGNYTPVAVIEHNVVEGESDVKNMVHLINNFENAPNSWWTIDGHCDDCNDKYNRKKTVMLLNNEDGTFRQIGTSCLKKYLGITCYNVINNFMTIDSLVEEELAIYGDDENFARHNKYIRTEHMLACIYDTYDALGSYVKNDTVDKSYKKALDNTYSIKEEYTSKAKELIKFFSDIDSEADYADCFVKNVKVAVMTEYAHVKQLGYLAYAPTLMDKLKVKMAKKQNDLNSEYIGNVGDKLEVEVEVTNCFCCESQYGYIFINIFKQVDSNNVLVWKTSTKSYSIGTKLNLKGTIKEHKEYNGVKQTVLTRVKEV